MPDIILDSYPGRLPTSIRVFTGTELRVYNRSPETDPSVKPSRFEQARVMGGGSSINGQFAVRGMRGDYDEWEEMGLKPAGPIRVSCPYFNNLERDVRISAGEGHGSAGRIPGAPPVSGRMGRVQPCGAWRRCRRTAFPLAGMSTADDADGCYPVPLSNQYDRRVSTAIGYLDAATRRRRNLSHSCRDHW